ncbi:MAG: hypothetical protein NTZ16_14805 [Verrucomicrobia bacterium]|nr:hypothetical protein [Verrucomicrobiota bacterium]
MTTETIAVTNKNGTKITLSFDAVNLIHDERNIGLRIVAQFGSNSRVIVIEASKTNYPTDESFLNRVEQFGKKQLAEWLQTSSDDSIIMPFDVTNRWKIIFE